MNLTKEQLDAVYRLNQVCTKGRGVFVVECLSKIVPDEVLNVVCILEKDERNNIGRFVPVAMLFPMAALDLCHPPKLENGDALIANKERSGWQLQP